MRIAESCDAASAAQKRSPADGAPFGPPTARSAATGTTSASPEPTNTVARKGSDGSRSTVVAWFATRAACGASA